jgi:hypothetical protein
MTRPPDDRPGLLIVRAWRRAPDGLLVARISWTADVADGPLVTSVAGTREEIQAAVEAWLANLPGPDGAATTW